MKDLGSPENRNAKQLRINFDNELYTVLKDREKRQLQLGSTGDVRLRRLTLKGMPCTSRNGCLFFFFFFQSRSRKEMVVCFHCEREKLNM